MFPTIDVFFSEIIVYSTLGCEFDPKNTISTSHV